jgi:hypothetical protein
VQARQHLHAAQAGAVALVPLVQSGQTDGARAGLRAVREDTRHARRLTSGPVWRLAGSVPLAGRTVATVAGVARAADEVLRDVVPPALAATDAVGAGGGLPPAGGRPDAALALDLHGVAEAAPALRNASRRAHETRARLEDLPSGLVPPPVVRARRDLAAELDRLLPALDAAASVAETAPALLGASGPRRYLLALQNTAEARGSGGLLGVYAVAVADRGRVRLERVGSDRDLRDASPAPRSSPEHSARYAPLLVRPGWRNANLSPHFPDAARIWSELWRRQSGQQVDGVLALDPAVLDALLAVTGPVRLPDGTRLTAGSAVPLTLARAYDVHDDHLQRKAFLVGLVPAVLDRLGRGDVRPAALARALLGPAREGRVRLYSRHPDEQRLLEGSPVGGALPAGPQPFALAVVNNAFGNKLDFYLDRRVDYALGPCAGGSRPSRIAVRLANRAPLGLGDYVTGRVEVAARGREHPYAHHRVLLSVFTTAGARLVGARLDGRAVPLGRSTERGHPVFDTYVDLPRGLGRTLVLDLLEPARTEPPVLGRQPLVRPQAGGVGAASCTQG